MGNPTGTGVGGNGGGEVGKREKSCRVFNVGGYSHAVSNAQGKHN